MTKKTKKDLKELAIFLPLMGLVIFFYEYIVIILLAFIIVPAIFAAAKNF